MLCCVAHLAVVDVSSRPLAAHARTFRRQPTLQALSKATVTMAATLASKTAMGGLRLTQRVGAARQVRS